MVALPFGEPGILTQALYDEPFKAVVPVEHRWEHKTQIDARQLEGEKCCFSTPVTVSVNKF